MISTKCFGMLPTSQNKCDVFVGIGAILTRRQKTVIVPAHLGCPSKAGGINGYNIIIIAPNKLPIHT
jgi:hypothetical protein